MSGTMRGTVLGTARVLSLENVYQPDKPTWELVSQFYTKENRGPDQEVCL